MEERVWIKKEIVYDQNLSNIGFAVYAVLRLYNQYDEDIFLNPEMVQYFLYGESILQKRHDAIIDGINDLICSDYVYDVKKLKKNTYALKLTKMKDDEFYVIFNKPELFKIFSIKGNTDKFKLFRYFVCLMGTLNFSNELQNYSGKLGFYGIEKIAKVSNVNYQTAMQYNKVLSELNLIYIAKHTWRDVDKNIHQRNIYCRKSDYMLCQQYLKEMSGYESQEEKLNEINKGRSLKQKYNQMVKGRVYSLKEKEEIYDYMYARYEKLHEQWEYDQEHNIIYEEPDFDITPFGEDIYDIIC